MNELTGQKVTSTTCKKACEENVPKQNKIQSTEILNVTQKH
jgi:hypothetical protein